MKDISEEQRIRIVIARRLTGLRTARGFTKDALAMKCKIHRTALSKIESGVRLPSIPMLCTLAEALGVPAKDLLEDGEALPRVEV